MSKGDLIMPCSESFLISSSSGPIRYQLQLDHPGFYVLVKKYYPEIPPFEDCHFCDIEDCCFRCLFFKPFSFREHFLHMDVCLSICDGRVCLMFSLYRSFDDVKDVIGFETVPFSYLQELKLIREVAE